MNLVQRAFCCPCGSTSIHARGLCLPCYDSRRRSQERFDGRRDLILVRDSFRCTACGEPAVVVHHRNRRIFVTLCPGDHARVHRTKYPRFTMSPYLRQLWREAHPGFPEQLLLELNAAGTPEPEQLPLIVLAATG